MNMNKADTRYQLIAPLLSEQGCGNRCQITLETVMPDSESSEYRWREHRGRLHIASHV